MQSYHNPLGLTRKRKNEPNKPRIKLLPLALVFEA